MKKKLGIVAAIVGLGLAATGGAASADAPDCNWGQLTSDSIADGFDQGGHASAFAGSARAGLANVIDQGDLHATCEFIEGP